MKRYAKLLTDGGYTSGDVLQAGDVAEIVEEKQNGFVLLQPRYCKSATTLHYTHLEAVEIFKDHPEHPEYVKVLKPMKIRTPTKEINRAVQDVLYDMGFKWYVSDKYFMDNGSYLFADNGVITRVNREDEKFFNEHENPEYVLKDGKLIPIEDIAQQESIEKDYIELTVKVMKKDIPDWANFVTVENIEIWCYANEPEPTSCCFIPRAGDEVGRNVLKIKTVRPALLGLDKPKQTFDQMSEKYKKGEIGKDELIKFLNEVVE